MALLLLRARPLRTRRRRGRGHPLGRSRPPRPARRARRARGGTHAVLVPRSAGAHRGATVVGRRTTELLLGLARAAFGRRLGAPRRGAAHHQRSSLVRPAAHPAPRGGQSVLPRGDHPSPDRRGLHRPPERSLDGDGGHRGCVDPRHRPDGPRGPDRPARGLAEAGSAGRRGRRARVLARARPVPVERRRGRPRRHAFHPRGPRACPVSSRDLDRRRARVHLQAHPDP